MREIKFRAWHHGGGDPRVIGRMEFSEPFMALFWSNIESEPFAVEVMQYAGLKDKNGKEIFEGDIVVKNEYLWFDKGVPNYRGTVEFIYSGFQVVAHCINPNKAGISDGANSDLNEDGFEENETSDWEIIGNVYENPELCTKP